MHFISKIYSKIFLFFHPVKFVSRIWIRLFWIKSLIKNSKKILYPHREGVYNKSSDR